MEGGLEQEKENQEYEIEKLKIGQHILCMRHIGPEEGKGKFGGRQDK